MYQDLKVGDLVKYKYDPVSKKAYLIATVDAMIYGSPGPRYATLLGWDRPNAAGGVQRFRLDQLEVISESR